jgi:hypothetical protein
MMHNLPSHLPPWLARIGASRYRLVLVIGTQAARNVLENVQRMAPSCVMLNLSLALSQRLLDIPSHQRPAQAPIILADLLTGQEPAMLYDIELLFDPTLQLEPLRALKAASRSRILLALWPGTSEGGSLVYAEPGHPEYKRYGPADLAEILVVPMAELSTEA